MTRFFSIAATAMALSVCTTATSNAANGVSLDSLVRTTAPPKASAQAAPRVTELPMASLASFSAEALTGTLDADGFQQTIELDRSVSGLRRNTVDIRYRRTKDGSSSPNIEKPTEAGIRDELASRFPTMEMLVVDQPRRNTYGVYGLAVGKWANGTGCIYAWQWIDDNESRTSPDRFDTLSLRISLCRANTKLDDLAVIIDNLRLGPSPRKIRAADIRRPTGATARASRVRHANAQVSAAPDTKRYRSATTMTQYATPNGSPVAPSTSVADDPGLDPSIPAAAYLGPHANASPQQAAR